VGESGKGQVLVGGERRENKWIILSFESLVFEIKIFGLKIVK